MAKKAAISYSPIRFIMSVVLLCLISMALLFARILSSDSMRYIFLLWNLILATIPPLVAYLLYQRVRINGWLEWKQIALTVVFLAFLPNSFYLVTDFVHLRETYEASLMFDVVLLASFMLSGLVLGYSAVFLMHKTLKTRLSEEKAYITILGLFVAVSFAIYLGRFTRWNTWDLLLQPAGLLFDVSDRFINPAVHTDTYMVTSVIFLMLASVYIVIYEGLQLARRI